MAILTLVRFIFSQFPKRFPVLLCFLILSGLLESIGVGAVIPIFEFFLQGRSFVATSPISQFVHSMLNFLQLPVSLPGLFALIIGLFFVKSSLMVVQTWFSRKMIRHFFMTESTALMGALVQCQWQDIHQEKQGHMLALFTTEMDRYCILIYTVILLLTEALLLMFYIGLSLFVSWQLTCCILVMLVIVSLPLKLYHSKVHRLSKSSLHARESFHQFVHECLGGLKWIKASGHRVTNVSLFQQSAHHKAQREYIVTVIMAFLPSFFMVFSVFSLTLIAYLALVVFKLSFSYFLLVTVIFYRLYPKFQQLQSQYQYFVTYFPSYTYFSDFSRRLVSCPEASGTRLFKGLKTSLSFKDVSFSYQEASPFQLSGFNLEISSGDFIGIVGPSGCGKTTVIDLLSGLLVPNSGGIYIDGKPLPDWDLASYRKRCAIVAQESFLFHDSIRNNLTWGFTGISDKALKKACQLAHAMEFIDPLPDGLDTVIGERGVKLSGGQRQRLSLARALLAKPSILILDEATSALDAESESFIHQSIQALKGSVTLILISHRLASVQYADRIVVMDKGRIIESGSWDKLSTAEGTFARFKRLQILD